MKNLNVTFVAILFALFALTSCEKESMTEMTDTTTPTTIEIETATTQRNIPTKGINVIFDEVVTLSNSKTFRETAQSRNSGYKEIGCGFDYDGCTKNQGNSLDYRYYPSNVNNLGAPFDGEDEYFFLEIEATPGMIMYYDIELSELTTDLDLFVFALDNQNRISQTKAMSVNPNTESEKISLTDLAPGIYIVVVDAYRRGIAGHYNLTMECSAVPPPPSIEVKKVVTNFGTFWANGGGQWTFIAPDSDMAFVYEETYNNGNNISLENVEEYGGRVTTTKVYLGLDTENATRETTTVEGNATSIESLFGYIIDIEYGS